ncbi:MAG TPA: dienelactone hydrolase family protein [Roseiarcus sp.]|nr:dienelactone hydrolase family protein [Roseiarcus sp.]
MRFDSAGSQATSIQGFLTKPDGKGPFPAVVLLHSCLGLPGTRRSIADMLAGWGYVALFVDDFTTRGLKETCAVDFPEGISDAYGALLYLSRLPFVDRNRIAAIGYSQGADTALQIAASNFATLNGASFKIAVAYYPPCGNLIDKRLKIPALILIGELDDVTPAADCERLAKQQSNAQLKLVVYPDARHLFDDPALADGKRLLGMWLQYNPQAAMRSRAELRKFLASRLGK